jgi:hypothetical protein
MAARLRQHALGVTWIELGGTGRTSHALRHDGGVWLVDPFEDGPALEAVAQLGAPAGVIQLLDRHNRDCAALAATLNVPHLKVPNEIPGAPFQVIKVLARPWWKEVALWWEAERTLVVAEAIGTAPVFAVGRRAGMHPLLRLMPPTDRFGPLRPERLLVGHGEPVLEGAAAAVDEAFAHARTDIPKLVWRFPVLLRAGR